MPIAKVVAILPRFQVEAGRDLNYKVCYPRASFDRQSIAWDLNYFKYYFLRLAGIPFSEQALEDDFSRLTKFLLSAPHDYFLYRDFQSRNIMLRGGQPFFRRLPGRPQRRPAIRHRLAPLRCQGRPAARTARAACSITISTRSARFITLDRDAFMQYYYAYVYIRIMQALGAYGFRGFYERKAHFLQSVPYALKNLRWLLHNVKLPIALPTLTGRLQQHARRPTNCRLSPPTPKTSSSESSAFHFTAAGRKDESGNGGGFVFDGRSLPNPGREERFKALTGRDAPVIEYLNQQESVHQFFASATVSGRRQHHRIPAPPLQKSDGLVWLHRRPAPLRLPGRATRQASARDAGVEVIVHHRELESRPNESHGPGRRPRHAAAPAYRTIAQRRWWRSPAERCSKSR